ncbi:MAG: hypothetical protein WCA44_08615 [Acidobacteriaceae bacterium]
MASPRSVPDNYRRFRTEATAPVTSPTVGVTTATSTTSRQIQHGVKVLF